MAALFELSSMNRVLVYCMPFIVCMLCMFSGNCLLANEQVSLLGRSYNGLNLAASPVASGEECTIWRVPGFDPIEDVPAIGNWKGDFQRAGAGNCYAVSVLTNYFFQRTKFTAREGKAFMEWLDDGKLENPLKIDEETSLKFLANWLSTKSDDKVTIGGYKSLRQMTAGESLSAKRFKEFAEALQYHHQTTTELHRYGGSILKSKLGFIPGLGSDSVIKDGCNIIRDRIRDDKRPVPIVLHPSGGNVAAGHVIVAYEMREYEDRIEILAWDVNYPPTDSDPRSTVVTVNKDKWNYKTRRYDGEERYGDFNLITVINPDGRRERNKTRKILTNYKETLERNSHLGRVVSDDSSLGDRIKGVAGFIGEHINPF